MTALVAISPTYLARECLEHETGMWGLVVGTQEVLQVAGTVSSALQEAEQESTYIDAGSAQTLVGIMRAWAVVDTLLVDASHFQREDWRVLNYRSDLFLAGRFVFLMSLAGFCEMKTWAPELACQIEPHTYRMAQPEPEHPPRSQVRLRRLDPLSEQELSLERAPRQNAEWLNLLQAMPGSRV